MPNGEQDIPRQMAETLKALHEIKSSALEAQLKADMARRVEFQMREAGLAEAAAQWRNIEANADLRLGFLGQNVRQLEENLTRLEIELTNATIERVRARGIVPGGVVEGELESLVQEMGRGFREARQQVETQVLRAGSRALGEQIGMLTSDWFAMFYMAASRNRSSDVVDIIAERYDEIARIGLRAEPEASNQVEQITFELGQARAGREADAVGARDALQNQVRSFAEESPVRSELAAPLSRFFTPARTGLPDIPGLSREIRLNIRTLPGLRRVFGTGRLQRGAARP